MVQRVERLELELKINLLMDLEGLVERRGEVKAAGQYQSVLAPVAEAQASSARPDGRDVVIDPVCVEPLGNGLGIVQLAACGHIRMVGVTAAQADRINR